VITQREANLIELLLDCVEFLDDLLSIGDMNEVHDMLINNAEDVTDRAREAIRETKESE
jgi:hypothetical protein